MADTLKAIEQLEAMLSGPRREPAFSAWIDPVATAEAQVGHTVTPNAHGWTVGREVPDDGAEPTLPDEKADEPDPEASSTFDQLLADAIHTTALLPTVEPEPDDADEVIDDVEVHLDGEFAPVSSSILIDDEADAADTQSDEQSRTKAKKKRFGKRG